MATCGNIYMVTYGNIYGNENPHALVTLAKRIVCFFEAAMQAAAMLGAVWRPKKLHNFPSKARDIRANKYDALCSVEANVPRRRLQAC